MEQLISHTLDEISREESESRVIAKRDLASEALSLLRKHRIALVKGYPMALLEVFADGPSTSMVKPANTGIDFGELTLVDDEEVQAQVELSRAQQVALHKTEEVLSELNGLVSAAQGLSRVQPERNPLRPENYIRALQRVVSETQVVAPVREAWMQHMRSFLGQQLVGVYDRASKGLRKHGVERVGWRSQSGAPVGYAPSKYMAGVPGPVTGHSGSSAYGPASDQASGESSSRMAGASSWQGGANGHGMHLQAEEAVLTVNILRQILAGGGDPYQQVQQPAYQQGGTPGMPMVQGGSGSIHAVPGGGAGYANVAASEAMEDIAQLERLVGRLAHSQSGFQHSVAGAPRSGQSSLYGTTEAAPMGAEVVARMVENISRDVRLLPPIQKAVQDLEPAIRKLIRHDARFFSDANHPARRLLDDVTQRSLAFTSIEAPGFSRFMRLVDQAVAHLSKTDITNAAPFETVRRALHAAWDAQQKKLEARQDREKRALLLAEAREMRAERVADEFGALPMLAGAPQDIADFVLGPWVEVVAAYEPADNGAFSAQALDAMSVAPLLLWSVQPELTQEDTDRLDQAAALLPVRLRAELEQAGHTQAEVDALIRRLAQLHREALLAAPPDITLPSVPAELSQPEEPETSESSNFDDLAAVLHDPDEHEQGGDSDLQSGASGEEALGELARDVPDASDESNMRAEEPPPQAAAQAELFSIGAWVELRSGGKWMRTQLTWFSPHNTLFLFTAPDGSTQSMTRRMRDKLVAQDALRLLDTRPVVSSAIDKLTRSTRNDAGTLG